MKDVKLFIFDMDGTLFDTEPISAHIWKEVGREAGYVVPDRVLQSIIGMSYPGGRRVFKAAMGDGFPFDTLCAEKIRRQNQWYDTHDVPLKKGVHEILDYAAKNGISCAVASSSPIVQIEKLLGQAGISDRFAYLQSGEDIVRGKPAPDIFLTACAHFGIDPADALVFEESANGLKAAAAGRIRSVWIPDIAVIPENVADTVWLQASSLAEVPRLLSNGSAKGGGR